MEDRLRTLLRDERRALPVWPDPVDRVSRGIRRRRRRRMIGAGAALVAVLAVSAAVLVQPSPTVPAGPVGFIDAPVPTPTSLARRSPRADRPGCELDRLHQVPWTETGAQFDGRSQMTVLLPNSGDTRCTLTGPARITAVDTRTGSTVVLAGDQQNSADGGRKQYPATIDPGEPARVDIFTGDSCGRTDTPVRYRQLAVVLGGQEFPIPGLELTSACPATVGSWYVEPPLLNAPLTVSIDAPALVRRGTEFEYTVSVLSQGQRSFGSGDCPVYQQRFGGQSRWLQLSCPFERLPAHRVVRFTMRVAVAADAPVGPTTLSWMAVLGDGTVAIADLATGGVPVEVV